MARSFKIALVVAFVSVHLTPGADALNRAEIEEIRSFASKAYNIGNNQNLPGRYPMEPQGSFSHYVGRRLKPFGIEFQPLNILMRRPRNHNHGPRPSNHNNNYHNPGPIREPQPAEGILNYSFLPPFASNHHKNKQNRRPPPPQGPKFRFGRPQSFTYSHPPVYMNGPPPALETFNDVGNSIFPFNNGHSPISTQHQQKLAAVMAQQHLSNLNQAQSQLNAAGQQEQKTKEVNTSVSEAKKPEEVLNTNTNQIPTVGTTPKPIPAVGGNIVPSQVDGVAWRAPISYQVGHYVPSAPQQFIHNEPIMPFGLPFTAGYHQVKSPQAVPMRIIYHGQGFPHGSNTFQAPLNIPPNYVRYESYVTGPVTTTESSKSTVPTSEPQTVTSTSQTPTPTEPSTVIFQSARIPEQVSISSSSGGSAYNNRPLTLTPEEQKNVFTAAADSSLVVAPLVYTTQSVSPIVESTQGPVVETIQRPDGNQTVSVSVYSEEVSSSEDKAAEEKAKNSVRVEQGVTSTVTRVLPSGKRVRFRKVKKSSKESQESSN